uniref:Uncharacterized protein n=1 Tax=Anguilla anguilla TaxID=7936 RepID=A0A0E9WF23_ANGAN
MSKRLFKPADTRPVLRRVETWESQSVSKLSSHQRVRLNYIPKQTICEMTESNISMQMAMRNKQCKLPASSV